MLMLNFLLWLVKSLIDDVDGLPAWDLNLKELLSVADTMTGKINLLLFFFFFFFFFFVLFLLRMRIILFSLLRFFIKKNNQIRFFFKNNKTETKLVPIWFGLTRFFIWLGFSSLTLFFYFFRFGFGSVWFFRFHAYKIETEPVGFLKILIDLIGFFLWFDFFF